MVHTRYDKSSEQNCDDRFDKFADIAEQNCDHEVRSSSWAAGKRRAECAEGGGVGENRSHGSCRGSRSRARPSVARAEIDGWLVNANHTILRSCLSCTLSGKRADLDSLRVEYSDDEFDAAGFTRGGISNG